MGDQSNRHTGLEGEHQRSGKQVGAALVRSHLLLVEGPDAREFLHNQSTAHLRSAQSGDALPTLFLNARGQIEAVGTILVGQDRFWVASEGDLEARFRRYIIFDQVHLTPLSWQSLVLYGSQTWLQARSLGVEHLAPGRWIPWGEGVLVGEPKRLLWLAPSQQIEELARQFEASGVRLSEAQYTAWRIAQGLPAQGIQGYLPQEVGLGAWVSSNKGCYIGQEIMARLEARGQSHHQLMGVLGVQGPGTLTYQGKKAGELLEWTVSPPWGGIGLARVRRDISPGTWVELEGTSVQIVALPLEPDFPGS